MSICIDCKKHYEYKRGRNSSVNCGSCVANKRRFKLKVKMVQYKGGQCESCGYKKNLSALTFHHLNPKEKDFDLSGAHCRKWETVKIELDKCICLCFNCHQEIHNPNLSLG